MVANLQTALNRVHNWCKSVKLELCAAKTTFMDFEVCSDPTMHLLLNEHRIRPANMCKYLGFTITNDLNWAPHFESKAAAFKKALFATIQALSARGSFPRRAYIRFISVPFCPDFFME